MIASRAITELWRAATAGTAVGARLWFDLRIVRVGRAVPLLVLLAMAGVAAQPSLAQQSGLAATSFLTPFPDRDIYRIRVFGDVMADGTASGLEEALADDNRIAFEEGVTRIDYLTRANWDDTVNQLEQTKPGSEQPSHIAVVLFGINDRTNVRVPGQRQIRLGSDAWREAYAQRIDRLMKALRAKKAAVYWVGLPIMRREEQNEYAQTVNAIVRERAFRNGVKFIDAYAGFSAEGGEYSAYGPDMAGENTLLRSRDGVYFSPEGYRKLAHFVEREIKRDVGEAVAQRSVPLLGTESELRRLLPNAAPLASADPSRRPALTTFAGRPAGGTGSRGGGRLSLAPSQPALGEQKADNSKVSVKRSRDGREETLTFEIIRPAISAAVLALVARPGTRAAQWGDTVSGRTADGMPVLASVTPADPVGGARALLPTQAPHFKLWARGERVLPRPGRVDDFSWPPPDVLATPAAAPLAPGRAPDRRTQ